MSRSRQYPLKFTSSYVSSISNSPLLQLQAWLTRAIGFTIEKNAEKKRIFTRWIYTLSTWWVGTSLNCFFINRKAAVHWPPAHLDNKNQVAYSVKATGVAITSHRLQMTMSLIYVWTFVSPNWNGSTIFCSLKRIVSWKKEKKKKTDCVPPVSEKVQVLPAIPRGSIGSIRKWTTLMSEMVCGMLASTKSLTSDSHPARNIIWILSWSEATGDWCWNLLNALSAPPRKSSSHRSTGQMVVMFDVGALLLGLVLCLRIPDTWASKACSNTERKGGLI